MGALMRRMVYSLVYRTCILLSLLNAGLLIIVVVNNDNVFVVAGDDNEHHEDDVNGRIGDGGRRFCYCDKKLKNLSYIIHSRIRLSIKQQIFYFL